MIMSSANSGRWFIYAASLLVVCGCGRSHAAEAGREAAGATYSQGIMIRFEGMITPLTEQFLYRKLDEARKRKADVVILEIDSPGGLVDPSFNIAQRMREVDWARTVAFVPRQALSGAAVVALGCDEIVMHPDAQMGDVGVITMGEDSLFRYAEEKVRTHIASQLRDLAEAKGRPPALAEAMVNMELVVYHATNRETGEKSFMSADEIQAAGGWEKGKPVFESRSKHFLEVNGKRAVELQLADGNARDIAELTQRLGLPEPPQVLKPGGVDTAVFILNLPLVTGLLFVVGLVALYIEFSAPGISVGGLIAVLCFALFFWSRFLGGTADVLEVVLFLAGVLFLAAEIFVIPGFGVAGLTGLLLITAGVVMASQDFVLPETPRQLGLLSTSLLVLAASGVIFLATAVVLSRYFGSLPVVNRLVLNPADASPASPADGKVKPPPAFQVAAVGVGDWGVAQSALRPSGRARFGDETLDVITDGSYVAAGQQIRIVEMQGSRILVAEVEENV